MARLAHPPRIVLSSGDAKVTPLELFFDLVFVFALTQVTGFMAHDLSWHGIVQALLLFGLLWWSWACYAWLGNVARADKGILRLGMLTAMAAMFVLALCIPETFSDHTSGLFAPVVVAVCYGVFRAVHLGLFWLIAAGDRELRRQLLRFSPGLLLAIVLLLVAAGLDGPWETLAWAGALLADYGGTMLSGSNWRLSSVGHFAERHGLILIVALGESIVAIGVGIASLPISWPIVIAALLGLVLASSLWWAYFDVTALTAEYALEHTPAERRPAFARDAYTYLHLPMAAGIVLLALGLKKVLEYVGNPDIHDITDPLHGIPLIALFGGTALYLLGHVGFRLRATRRLNTPRLIASALVLALILPAEALPALAQLGLLTALVVVLLVIETIREAEHRHWIRGHHTEA